jgi:hypothetical protein
MATTFGLVTEGKTDQVVIDNILAGYFKSPDIDVRELQPLRDETDQNREDSFGGWYRVFEYCRSSRFREAFQFNDYIIVQIDTDRSEDTHYDIPKYQGGKELTPEQLIERVIKKFAEDIGESFFSQHRWRIIFAISVHSIECWLLPLYENTKKRAAATKNCLKRLKKQLNKRGLKLGDKDSDDYNEASKPYRRHRDLMRVYENNPSLKIFITELQSRNVEIEADDF